MNKYAKLVVGLIAVFALVGVASASTDVAALQAQIAALQAQIASMSGSSAATSGSVPTDITKDLSLGSKGDQVTSLQQYLMDEGLLDIDAPTGYFGAKTKAAVVQWQKDNDVSPAAGYFGSKSRAALEGLGEAVVVPPVTSTTTASGTPVVVGMDNSDGSINIGVSSIAPTTQTLKKGDTKDIYAIRFTATGGNVNVNRVDVHFTLRPWLVFDKVVLKDASGNVLATKTLTGASDVTVVTEGSEYYVRFDNLPTIVVPGTDTNLVVSASVPSNNSFVGQSGYTSVNVTVPSGSIRTVNGKGIYDSAGLSQTNVVTLSSTGNSADLAIGLAPNSPLNNQVYIAPANGADTPAVPLAIYRIQSTNQATTLTTLTFAINTSPDLTLTLSSSMKNYQLIDGTNHYYGTLSGNVVTFTFPAGGIVVAANNYKDLTLAADVVATNSSFSASTTLKIGNGTVAYITANDSNYNTPTFGGLALTTNASVVSSDLTFTSSAMTFTGGPTGLPVANNNGTAAPIKAQQNYSLTLKNIGSLPLYVSSDAGVIFSTTTSPAANSSSSVVMLTAPAPMAGDVSGAYIVPAGATRTFSVTNIIGKSSASAASDSISVTAINYGQTSGSPTGKQITANLSTLSSAYVW